MAEVVISEPGPGGGIGERELQTNACCTTYWFPGCSAGLSLRGRGEELGGQLQRADHDLTGVAGDEAESIDVWFVDEARLVEHGPGQRRVLGTPDRVADFAVRVGDQGNRRQVDRGAQSAPWCAVAPRSQGRGMADVANRRRTQRQEDWGQWR